MTLLTLLEGELAFGMTPLLDRAHFVLQEGERVGLIGRNGTGKSSLLAAFDGRLPLDDGEVRRRGAPPRSVPKIFPLGLYFCNICSEISCTTTLPDATMARPRNFDESAVIDAAVNAFWMGGLGSTSVDDVLRATGLSRSSLYSSFGGKDAVLRLAIERYVDQQIPEIDKAFRGRSLRKALETIFDGIARSNNEGKGCLLINGVNELPDEDTDARQAIRAGFARLAKKFAEVVRAADPERRGGRPELVAAQIMTAIAGLRTLQRTGLPEATVRQTARRYAEWLGGE